MNFIGEYFKGQEGGNKGLPMGNGLLNISKAVNGVQRQRLYGLAAPPKAGKSTFSDNAFIIGPYLHCIENNITNIEWIYLSYEIDRVSKEFDFATFFLNYDYGIRHIDLPKGITCKGQSFIELSSDYLRGRLQDDNNNIIKVDSNIEEKLKEIYYNRIVPLFGEYSRDGILISKGVITFIETRDNPTGIRNFLIAHAELNGQIHRESYGKSNRIVGYTPKDENKYTIVIMDHLRKLIPERNFLMKANVDKFIEYCVELRNWFGYTFLLIIHTNRDLGDTQRLKFAKDMIYPTSDDIKDTGNLAEEADYLITMFNPNDDRYNINKHFGMQIKDESGNQLYPYLRTLHLVESRHCMFPQHFKVNMNGGLKAFKQFSN